MLFIKRNGSVFDIEYRFSNGKVNYVAFPAVGATWRFDGKDGVVLENGIARMDMRRTDFVVPQGESLQSFLNYLLNPSPDILPFGVASSTGGGTSLEPNLILANYQIQFADKDKVVVFGNPSLTAKLPIITPSNQGYSFLVSGGNYGGTVACWDTPPENNRIIEQTSIYIAPWESAAFVAIDSLVYIIK